MRSKADAGQPLPTNCAIEIWTGHGDRGR